MNQIAAPVRECGDAWQINVEAIGMLLQGVELVDISSVLRKCRSWNKSQPVDRMEVGTGSVAVSSVSGCSRYARIAKTVCLLRARSVDGAVLPLRGHGSFSRAATT